MLAEKQLEEAVRLGIIQPTQAEALKALAVGQIAADPLDDYDQAVASGQDEPVRLIGGGNDVFVTIGVLLLMAGAYFALSSVLGAGSTLIYAVFVVFSWLVAEIITRQKRMKLASSVLAVICIICIALLLNILVVDRFRP